MLTNLKTAMMLRGMRGYELAAKLGIHGPALSEIIQGRRQPSQEVRRHAARILQAREDWLFAEVTISHAGIRVNLANARIKGVPEVAA